MNIEELTVYSSNTSASTPANLRELLQYQDCRFVEAAYEILLARKPDKDGYRFYLSRIRDGVGKIQILREISRSQEAVAQGRNIKGLQKALVIDAIGSVPVIGTIMRRLLSLEGNSKLEVRLRILEQKNSFLSDVVPAIVSQQNASEARLSEVFQLLGQLSHQFSQLSQAIGRLEEQHAQDVQSLAQSVEDVRRRQSADETHQLQTRLLNHESVSNLRAVQGESLSTQVERVSMNTSSTTVFDELLFELYGNDGPLNYARSDYLDHGYPHTNLIPEVAKSVLETVKPRFWLELGSMLGGSAIRVADIIKSQASATKIVCVDPFTGDVNMWAWEQPKKKASEWQFLRVERGKPTIFERFLANVSAAGHSDVILPIAATSIVGLKLLERLVREQRLSFLPDVIYLDSAHEPDETFLELQNCWRLLTSGGVLMGDDWSWDSVRNDVIRFAQSVEINGDARAQLSQIHRLFTQHEGILLDRGQWVIMK